MYRPEHTKSTDLSVLDWLAEQDSFGTLISIVDSAPFATHMPVLLRRSAEAVRILGHWARQNPQWRNIEQQRTLFIFHGPHAYISPQWYPEPSDNVPTWNYVVTHLYGRIRIEQDMGRLRDTLSALAEKYEASTDDPWTYERASARAHKAINGIVGFELAVDEVQIKQKLSQHHPEAHVLGAIAGLRSSNAAGAGVVANLMENSLRNATKIK